MLTAMIVCGGLALFFYLISFAFATKGNGLAFVCMVLGWLSGGGAVVLFWILVVKVLIKILNS